MENSKLDKMDDSSERLKMGERLRSAREYLGFSQDQIAQHLAIPRSALSNIENGQRGVDAVELKRLAILYQKPVAYFTGEPGIPENALPPDVEHLARKASTLTRNDRDELSRFADFLQARPREKNRDVDGGK